MSSSFTPGRGAIEARDELRRMVDRVLRSLASGALPPDLERERVDLKEEAGRRGAGGVIQPGTRQNISAADHLASEVTCMANTPDAHFVGNEPR